MKNFLDELLEEVESKEKSERLAYYDLAIKEITELEIEIADIFSQSVNSSPKLTTFPDEN